MSTILLKRNKLVDGQFEDLAKQLQKNGLADLYMYSMRENIFADVTGRNVLRVKLYYTLLPFVDCFW